MTESDGRSSGATPQTRPPASEPVDWDDDTVPGFDVDEQTFNRATVIPELSSELFAKKMMEAARTSLDPGPVSGGYECKVPGPPPVPWPSQQTPAPFELERALYSAPAPASTQPGSERSARELSTAPPPGRTNPDLQRPLEIDQSALDSAVAARGRWARTRSGGLDVNLPAAPPSALEVDLEGLEASLPPASDPQLRPLTDRFAMGDYTGALVVAEAILERNPDHGEAARYAQNCRDVLMQMYSARIGSLDQVVSMAIPAEQIRWLSLDHRSGFLLSLVDGTSSIEEILDISGMPRFDALRIMCSLFSEHVVALSPR